ncbi:MAG TPA: hypothetical protein VF074_14850 [Pyrinomonadaceae bacterium]
MIQQIPRQILILFSLLAVTQMLFGSAAAQRKVTPPRATKFRLERHPHDLASDLFITVNGRERKVTTKALHAWIIDDGRSVIYSGTDGSGGFENEGESLRIYDVSTGRIRKILSEYVAVWAVQGVRLSTGQLALLVSMADGGLGGSYFAVVDPKRGQVMYRRWAEVTKIDGDRITLAFYKEDDWEKINEPRHPDEGDRNQVISHTDVKPTKIEHHDLKRVLRGRVIHNRRSPM